MELINELLANFKEISAAALVVVGSFAAFITALYALFLLIPGDQPDKTIKKILDFTEKFSKK